MNELSAEGTATSPCGLVPSSLPISPEAPLSALLCSRGGALQLPSARGTGCWEVRRREEREAAHFGSGTSTYSPGQAATLPGSSSPRAPGTPSPPGPLPPRGRTAVCCGSSSASTPLNRPPEPCTINSLFFTFCSKSSLHFLGPELGPGPEADTVIISHLQPSQSYASSPDKPLVLIIFFFG